MNTSVIQQYIQSPNNLFALLSRYRVVIPGIQRHYVQGAKNPKAESIRKQFVKKLLTSIREAKPLNLHFIYGPIDTEGEDSFVPVDGQQRLTTLWLIARYAVERTETPLRENILQVLSRFTYEDRIHAKRFCQTMTLPDSRWNIVNDPNPEILRQSWFLDYWKEDETVASMIRMLSTIHQEWDSELTGEMVLERLASVISFELKVDSFGDDIYMKMNARGLQLTQWENFKSKFSESLSDYKDEWEKEIEELSNTFFEKSADKHELPDNGFFALFARVVAYESNNECGNSIKQLAEFKHDTWQNLELPFVPYSDFGEIIKAPKFIINNVAKTCSVLIRAALENHNEKVPYFSDRILFDTLFHPKDYNEIDFTICCYEYFKAFRKVENREFLKATRLIWNILENVDREDLNRISIIKRFISLKVPSLYSHDDDALRVLFGANDAEQVLEEMEKSIKMFDVNQTCPDDWDEIKLGEWVNWNKAIEDAEEKAFFNGSIRFLYRDAQGAATWEYFATKLIHCTELFTKKGLKDDKKVKTNQILISHCDKWERIKRIPVFDGRKESWKRILTKSSLSYCVNNMLLTPDKIADNDEEILKKLIDDSIWKKLIKDTNGYELEWKANCPSLWLNRYLACTLKLWRNNREDILDAFNRNPNIYFEYSDQDRFLCINGENYYYAIPIPFTYQYKGKKYRFVWQTWGWIDMYDQDKKLYDLYYSKYEKGFNIQIIKDENNPFNPGVEYYIQKIKECIESYEKFISQLASNS